MISTRYAPRWTSLSVVADRSELRASLPVLLQFVAATIFKNSACCFVCSMASPSLGGPRLTLLLVNTDATSVFAHPLVYINRLFRSQAAILCLNQTAIQRQGRPAR